MVSSSGAALEIFVAIPWGSGPDEVVPLLQPAVLFGAVSDDQMREIHAPLRIRLDPQAGLHTLSEVSLHPSATADCSIHHFDPLGRFEGRTPLAAFEPFAGDDLRIADYIVDAQGNCCFLARARLEDGLPVNLLQCIDRLGQGKWRRVGPVSDQMEPARLGGTFRRLLMDAKSRLYVLTEDDASALVEIDRATGDLGTSYPIGEPTTEAFMAADGRVAFVWFSTEANLRGLGYLELPEATPRLSMGTADLSQRLLYPIGTDDDWNVYSWQFGEIARIDPDGQVAVIGSIDNIVVDRATGSVYTSFLRAPGDGLPVVEVTRHRPGAETVRVDLQIPARHAERGGDWRLVHVEGDVRCLVFGGEGPVMPGMLLTYSASGVLENETEQTKGEPRFESRLAPYSLWQVDRSGRIYLPLTDPEGLIVVRLKA